MAASDARPIPIKNTAFRAVFPILDADGDLVTGATGLDSEVSKDQGTFADCTNEATEIATSSGMYYLDLTSTEMNADCVAVIVKTTSSGAKTTVLVFYPEETGDINVDVTAYGGTAGTFSGGRPEVNTTHAAGTAWGSGAITAASIANGAIDAATFAADVDAEILSYLVDDATRIDASALNTASVTTIPAINTKLGTIQDLESGATVGDNLADTFSYAYSNSTRLRSIVLLDGEAVGDTGNDTTHVHLNAGHTEGDDEFNDHLLVIYDDSEGERHARWITDWVLATELATLHEALPFTPEVGDTYSILAIRQDVTGGSGLDAAGVRAAIGLAAANLDTQLDAIPTAAEVWAAGTRTLTALDEDSTTLDLDATILAAVGLASANLDTQLADIEGKVDDLESRLGTPSDLGSGATIAANLVDIEGQTDDIGVAGAGLTALATAAELAKVPKSDSNVTWNATAAAQIQTEANDAIVANRLDELLAADSDIDGAAPPTVGSVFHELMSKTAGSFTFDQTTDSHEAIRDKLTDIETDTGEIGAAGAGLTALATQASVNTIDDFLDTEVAAIKAKTDQLTFTTANQVDAQTVSMAANVLTAAATHSDFGTEVATAVWASATRTLSALGFTLGASDLAADTIGASELAADAITEIVNAVLTTAMTESYNTDGAAPTLAQAIFVTMQRLTEFAISGTTISVKKLDGSTTAYTLTLDDATSPTSSTRAS